MASQSIQQQVVRLSQKPGHGQVKHLLCNILKEKLGAKDNEIALESQLLTCRGRIDTLWGRTVFEIKRDLNRELSDAKNQIKKYIKSKETETEEKYVGIVTDGQKYIAYCLLNNILKEINQFTLTKDKVSNFIQWLESVILIKSQLEATPEIICKEIGQESPLCRNSLMQLKFLWAKAKHKPDIRLKYNLWKKSVDIVYGTEGTDEFLFIEHTYLTIISKAIAYISFFNSSSIPSGKYLLNGKLFEEASVFGVVEDDFFSWVTFCNKGNDLIKQILSHIKRFDFSTIKADILKNLYEGLIRQEQRHKMGEYYTPDWLAEKICKETIKKPLEHRVIDPSCGSGTFLFHSIKLLIKTAKKNNISSKKTIGLICEKITGIDIHPVAVIFSRITYLLAMLNEIKKDRPDKVTIPIYLGDSLQWSKDEVLGKHELRIQVPEDTQTGAKSRQLVFPESICQDSNRFDEILKKMIELAGNHKEKPVFEAWFNQQSTNEGEYNILSNTYQNLLELQKEGRNHIWGYVARNLTRPIWLSSDKQKADVVIGNPPWLKFNSMNEKMQKKFKSECRNTFQNYGSRRQTAFQTSQDISTYFFIISIHLYMREKGTLAFVLPYGVINGEHHSNFRTGHFKVSGSYMNIKFKNAWAFDSEVKNLFEIPSCVLFSERRGETEKPLPEQIIAFKGELLSKNASLNIASKALSEEIKAWPSNDYEQYSYYYDKFKQGASLVPRRFNFVKKIERGQLGGSFETPLVKGITSNQDKTPWNKIEPLEAKMESQFLRPVYTGQSIAPFRTLNHNIAIIPWDNENGVMDASMAEKRGHTNLSNYLEKVEKLWSENSSGSMTFKRRVNYNATLEKQFPISKLRVVYTASGTNVSAVLLTDSKGIIDTKLYWTSVDSKDEGIYIEGILNSDCLIEKIRGLQSQGQWGARDIHRHLLKPPIPKYDPKHLLHNDIVNHTKEIKKIVQNVEIDPSWYFIKSRKKVREAIKHTDTWKQLNHLINKLLKDSAEASPKEAKIQKQRIRKVRKKVPKGEQVKKLKSGRNKS